MPVVPAQVVNLGYGLPDYSQVGEGMGQLGAALLDYYRRRGPQLYQSPTGATTQISPAERVAGSPNIQLADLLRQRVAMTPGANLTPTRLPFLPAPQTNISQLAQQYQIQQAQAELEKAPYEIESLKEKTAFTRSQRELVEKMVQQGLIPLYDQQGNLIGAQPSSPAPNQLSGTQSPQGERETMAASPISTERLLEPTKLEYPGQVLVESGKRAIGRMVRERETPRALEASYKAKTAQAARGFGDTANIAAVERKMMEESFPKDGDSYEGRITLERSLFDPQSGFFPMKKSMLQQILSQSTPMVPSSLSGGKVSLRADPAIEAAKRQAATDLSRLQQTEVLYRQMFEEANRKMPPIGARLRQSELLSPEGLGGEDLGQLSDEELRAIIAGEQ